MRISTDPRHEPFGPADVLLAAFAFLTTLLIFYPFARLGVDAYHDGLALKPALDVLDGQTLYRDTFSNFGPLAVYMQAACLWLFGPTLAVLKIATVVLYALAASLFICVGRAFLPRPLAALAHVLWLATAYFFVRGMPLLPWSAALALVFEGAALLCLIQALRAGDAYRWAFLAGLAAALTFWCRAPLGLALFGGLLATFCIVPLLGRKKSGGALLPCALGFGAVQFFFVVILFVQGALGGAWSQMLLSAGELAHLEAKQHALPFVSALLPGVRQGGVLLAILLFIFAPLYLRLSRLDAARGGRKAGDDSLFDKTKVLILYYGALGMLFYLNAFGFSQVLEGGWAFVIPVAVAGFAAAFVPRAFSRGAELTPVHGAALAAAIVGLASWTQYYPSPSPRHVFWALAPLAAPFVFVALQAVRQRAALAAALLILLFLPLFVRDAFHAADKLGAEMVDLNAPSALAGMRVSPTSAYRLQLAGNTLEQYGRTHPRTPILIESPDALWGVFVRSKANPGPYYTTFNENAEHAMERRLAFIDRARPIVFLAEPTLPIVNRLNQDGYRPILQTVTGLKIMVPLAEARPAPRVAQPQPQPARPAQPAPRAAGHPAPASIAAPAPQ